MTSAADPAPSGARGFPPPPLAGWQLAWRLAVVGFPFVLALVLVVAMAATGQQALDWRVGLDLAGFPVAVGIARFRRRRPLLVALLVSLLVAVSSTSVGVWAWVVVSMATRRRWRDVVLTGAATLASFGISTLLGDALVGVTDPALDSTVMRITTAVTILGTVVATYVGLVAWGFYLGARRDLVASLHERAEIAEQEQILRAGQARADERARIAREMHDVLAHRISLMSMHAGILAYRDDLTPEQTKEIATIISANASESLTELRAVLGTLRETGQAPAKPQPTLQELPALLDDAARAGARVRLIDTRTAPETLPAPTGRHAYRIVQESLTNARKHAVAAPVTLTLAGGGDVGLTIEVSNPLTADSRVPGAGLGLVGLTERAQLVGGTCTAGVVDGRFVVRAWLPWET